MNYDILTDADLISISLKLNNGIYSNEILKEIYGFNDEQLLEIKNLCMDNSGIQESVINEEM